MQFQALAPTLDLLALMSTDGTRFVGFQRGGTKCFTGPACPRNLARLVPIALPAPQLADEACITGYSGPRRRILIADDVPANRQLLAAMLQPLGFDTAEALHGQDALDQVQRVLGQVIQAVEFLFLFTLAAGLVVLFAEIGRAHV